LAEELIRRDQHIGRLERIIHAQTMQSAAGYAGNRRTGVDTGSGPVAQNDQVSAPAEPGSGHSDDNAG
jgi:hypothetical protein